LGVIKGDSFYLQIRSQQIQTVQHRIVVSVVWNRSKFEKVPGTNTRRRKLRPESDWKRINHPELAIVSVELWDDVQKRLSALMGHIASAHVQAFCRDRLQAPIF